jgi:hypothetical protein
MSAANDLPMVNLNSSSGRPPKRISETRSCEYQAVIGYAEGAKHTMYTDWDQLMPQDAGTVIGFVEQFLPAHFLGVG